MSVANYFNTLDQDLALTYAIHLKPLISKVIHEECYGCQVDHPSQIQHNVCLMMEEEEQIRLCLKKALMRVNERKVLRLFRRFASFGKCLTSPTYIFEEAWRSKLWETDAWLNLVVQKILSLD